MKYCKYPKEIVEGLNGKKFSELSLEYQNFIQDAFHVIYEDEIVTCHKCYSLNKASLIIGYHGKRIYANYYVKKGEVVHEMNVYRFSRFLKEIGYSKTFINNFLLYHWGDDTTSDTGNIRLNVEQIKEKYPTLIATLNKKFSDEYAYKKLIELILFKDEKLPTFISYIFFKTGDSYVYYSRQEIMKHMLNHRLEEKTFLHIGPFSIQNKKRNIIGNVALNERRQTVLIKWYDYEPFIKKWAEEPII